MEFKCQQPPYIGMDIKHRENIFRNMEKLIDETDYKALKKECREHRLLSTAMINKIEAISDRNLISDKLDDEALQRERHRRLFKKLTKRGPDAYQHLKQILINLGYHKAVMRLNGDDNDENDQSHTSMHKGRQPLQTNNSISSEDSYKCKPKDDDCLELCPYKEQISPHKIHEVVKSKIIQVDDKVDVYPMKSQHNRGVLFMVNIINFQNKKDYRKGAKEDGESLLYLFKEFGFKLYAYKDLTHLQFFDLLGRLLKSDEVQKAECFVMALMTHGDMDENSVERVQFTDGSIVKVNEILECFTNENCVNLVKKPKIFIFPFCRGIDYDFGHMRTQTDGMATVQPRSYSFMSIPSVTDIIICYATTPGYRSHRDVNEGSWYIQSLCELMAKHAHNTHFEDIIKMIQNDTGEKRSHTGAMQTGNFNNVGFNKKLFFNPGAYESSE